MNLREKNVESMTFSSGSGKDVKDTKHLKGEAQDSLTGKNVTKPDSRDGGKGSFGKLGGLPSVK